MSANVSGDREFALCVQCGAAVGPHMHTKVSEDLFYMTTGPFSSEYSISEALADELGFQAGNTVLMFSAWRNVEECSVVP